MYNADEKKAFEDMMAEIEDSDEDDDYVSRSKAVAKPAPKYGADSKNSGEPSSMAGAKSNGSLNNLQNAQTFKMSKQEEEIEKFGSDVNQSAAHAQSEQISITKRWLMRSCSMNDRNTMKCFVERERSTFGMQTTYRCYLEGSNSGNNSNSNGGGSNGNSNTSSSSSSSSTSNSNGVEAATGAGGRFLMSAKKRVVNKTSYYLISLDPDAGDDRGSESVLGKVRRGEREGMTCSKGPQVGVEPGPAAHVQVQSKIVQKKKKM